MSALLDARPVAIAAKAALDITLAPKWKAWDYDELPEKAPDGKALPLPNIFALLSIERRFNETRILSGDDGLTGWRIAVRSLGRTVDEALWAMFKVATALDGQRLTINGALTPPIQFESDQAPTPDETRYGGISYYTF